MVPPLARMAVVACCNLIPDPMSHYRHHHHRHHHHHHVEGHMNITMKNKSGSCASWPNRGADAVLLNIGIHPFLPSVSKSHRDPGLEVYTMFSASSNLQKCLQYSVPYSSKSEKN